MYCMVNQRLVGLFYVTSLFFCIGTPTRPHNLGCIICRLHGTDLCPLRICYSCVAWSSCGTPNMRAGTISDSFARCWSHFPPTWCLFYILNTVSLSPLLPVPFPSSLPLLLVSSEKGRANVFLTLNITR
mgnify:CR=1 FL=1